MCYGIIMSSLVALSGFITSYYLKITNATPYLYLPIGYLAIMETFQSIQYFSVTYDLYTLNTYITTISYIHICFQPLFMNMFQFGYNNKHVHIYQLVVYPLCFMGGLGMLMRLRNINVLYDKIFDYWSNKHIADSNCHCNRYVDYFESDRTIAFIGSENHIGWNINLHKPTYTTYGMNIHCFLMFILPTVVEKMITIPTIVCFLGALASQYLSDTLNVQPALWCLIHTPLMMLAIYINYRKNKH